MHKDIALKYYESGLCPIPMNPTSPHGVNWRDFIDNRPDPMELEEMDFETWGVALCSGQASGDIECIDIDFKNDDTKAIIDDFSAKVEASKMREVFKKLCIQRTKSGGLHIIYATKVVGNSRILAYNGEGKRPIIELIANGGLFNVWPTPGYTVSRGDLCDLHPLTPDERHTLLSICLSLDRKPVRKKGPGLVKFDDSKTEKYSKVVEKIISQVHETKVDITAGYGAWVKIGHGLAQTFQEDGREYFHELSQYHINPEDPSKSYNREKADKKFTDLLKQRSLRKHSTVLSVFDIAKDYGIDIRDPKPEVHVEDDKSYQDPIEKWVQSQSLYWNNVTQRIENRYEKPIDDFDFNELWIKCRHDTNSKTSKSLLEAHLFNYKNLIMKEPLTDYFDALSVLAVEGDPIEEFLSHIKLKNELWKPFLKKWLVSIVASAYGHPSELILVLLGPQYNGKTQFFTRLFPPELEPYFAVDKLDQGKDSDILMTQKLLILDDEFSGKSKKDANHLKAMASRASFSVRLPYGRITKDLKRLAVLCGSSNLDDVINDNTGNRRIVPIEVIERDYQKADACDREILWAALVHEFLKGSDSWKLTDAQVAFVRTTSEDYQAVNPERDLIARHFEKTDERDCFFTATDICDHIMKRHPQMRIYPNKIGQELTQMGFQKVIQRIDGSPRHGYQIKVRGTGDIEVPF